jgi:hypothetical protein
MAQGQKQANCSLDFFKCAQQKLGNSNKNSFSPEYFIPPIIFDSLENQFVTIHFPIIHLKGNLKTSILNQYLNFQNLFFKKK